MIMDNAKKQNAIVSSLFPKSIQKKLMEEVTADYKLQRGRLTTGKVGLKNYLSEEDKVNEATNTKPIADLFPETTIMFADIAGKCFDADGCILRLNLLFSNFLIILFFL